MLLRSLGAADLRNFRRDPLLIWMVIFPPAVALLFRLLVPWLHQILLARWGFELEPYYPLIMSFFLLTPGVIAGVISGFVLLDERDEGVLTAIAVTPVPWWSWLTYRLAVPLGLGTVLAVATYPLVGVTPLPLLDLVVIAGVAALIAPVTALFLAAFAANKVSGFAMIKILNTVNMIPIIAWFFDPPVQWIAGIVPSYWPMKMIWEASAGRAYWAEAIAGVLVSMLALVPLERRFRTRLER
jgi:fluoroquinolone transport system permease protein